MIVSPRVSLLASAFIALACCTAGATSPSPDRGTSVEPGGPTEESARSLPPPSERLLWDEIRPQQAQFVPEAVLKSRDLEKIPMIESLRKRLLWELRIRQYPLLQPVTGRLLEPGCGLSGSPPRPGSNPSAEELPDVILGRDAAVLATVDEIVPGFGWGYGGPQTAVYGTVVEVLHDKTGTFQAGGEVSFQRPGADITVQRVRLCQEPSKGVHEPRPYDRLLIAGYSWPVNPGLLHANTVFPVEHGALVPQAYSHIKGRMDWTIEELRAALAAKGRP